jgi:hypothetical protein
MKKIPFHKHNIKELKYRKLSNSSCSQITKSKKTDSYVSRCLEVAFLGIQIPDFPGRLREAPEHTQICSPIQKISL